MNNAGQNYTVPALDIDIDELEEVFQANVFGVMRMCKAFSGMLVESKGTIVMVGSLAPVLRYVFSAGYNASKAALHAYSETLRQASAETCCRAWTIEANQCRNSHHSVCRLCSLSLAGFRATCPDCIESYRQTRYIYLCSRSTPSV